MKRLRLFAALSVLTYAAFFPALFPAYSLAALPTSYTLGEYNAALSAAQSAVNNATAEVAAAQAAVDASAVYHETSTVIGPVNVVLNGTFDDASVWSSIGMGDNSTILNSSIARVYNGVLIGSYNYGNFMYQTGTFATPTRQVTFTYDMSNNNFNDGARPQADMYRVEFRTYSATGARLNYYNTSNRTDVFGWTTFTASYDLPEDAVRWDIGFRLADSGYWNGNFGGSVDNVRLFTNATTVTPAYTTYDQALVTILNQKKSELAAAQSALAAIPPLAINAPSQLVATSDTSTVTLNWAAPTANLIPERYAISWTDGTGGWGIATGNAGDANALNTFIVIDKAIIGSTGGWDKNYTFTIRSDHDSGHMYSAWSNEAVLFIASPAPVPTPLPSDTPTPTAEPTPTQTSTPQPSATPEPSVSPVPSPEPSPTPTPVAPEPSPSPTPSATPEPSPEPSLQPSPTPQPSPETSPVPSPTPVPVEPTPTPTVPPAVEPEPTPSPTPTAPPVDPQPTTPPVAEPVPVNPTPTPSSEPVQVTPTEPPPNLEPELPPEPAPEPVPEPPVEPQPPVVIPDPEGSIGGPPIDPPIVEPLPPTEPQPPVVEPEEPPVEPVEPPVVPEPPVEPEPKPELPEPEPQNPKPESQLPPPPPEVAAATKDGNISDKEADAVVDALSADGKITNAEVASLVAALAPKGQELTQDQKDLVADVIVEQFKGENAVPASALEAAGIEFKDLPEETPVEVRQDENGNEVIITADVAAALVLLENPSELIGAIFSDPSQALQAFANIGADMSTQEREESTKAVVATVIAAGAAINAVGAAAGAAGGSTGGSTGGGGASGESGYRRRKP